MLTNQEIITTRNCYFILNYFVYRTKPCIMQGLGVSAASKRTIAGEEVYVLYEKVEELTLTQMNCSLNVSDLKNLILTLTVIIFPHFILEL